MSSWTQLHTFKDVEVTFGDEVELLLIEIEATYSRGWYGGDGHLGEMQTNIEGWKVEAIWDVDTGADVTDMYKDKPEIEKAIEQEIKKL